MGNLLSHITQIHKHKTVILLNVKKQWNSYLGVRIFIKSLAMLRKICMSYKAKQPL